MEGERPKYQVPIPVTRKSRLWRNRKGGKRARDPQGEAKWVCLRNPVSDRAAREKKTFIVSHVREKVLTSHNPPYCVYRLKKVRVKRNR